MQTAAKINQQRNGSPGGRRDAFGGAFVQIAGLFLGGCWRHRMGRPFTREGRTYRVCLSCGMTRDFDPATWKTFGPYRGRA
ncbi:MAG: hypothetical protein ACJ754_01525 [Pyrinomonadaceae bacterium]